ncbi:hypothetical protein BTUL_0047g00080 [Botrytis tulipae]|uniref:Carboxylic ester hydrolase n=1 Tax=Botrytis tulipae TaxID=87230 RepID=A0A4Z1ERB7_9HELO|nr:hypothetical protein BTUL_0047g00080 [Botrytis tulipae]
MNGDISEGLWGGGGSSPDLDYPHYFLGLGTNFTADDWNPEYLVALSEALDSGNATADYFDLSPFYKKGSMIIHYHGMAGNFIATASSYIGGTTRSSVIGGCWIHSKPGLDNAQHDVLLALIDWVENDTAPTRVIATKWNDEATLDYVTNQRPNCMYPQQAKYVGTGNTSVAANWEFQSLY